ncbi:MAG: cohesin domain-containing protein [bacterium]
MKWFLSFIINLFLLLAIGAGSLQAASIGVSDASGSAGAQDVLVSVDLTTVPEEDVVALQFDICYDAAQLAFNEVTAGQVIIDAGKEATSATPSAGTTRVIVYGLNQNSIADGTLVAIGFNINASASAGEEPLTVSNAVASDPDAHFIALSTVNGSITISSSGADGSPEESNNEENSDGDEEIEEEILNAFSGCWINTLSN